MELVPIIRSKVFKQNLALFFIGVFALLLGAIEYYTGRPESSVHFQLYFTNINNLLSSLPDIHGSLGNFAPTFFHALAFSLISISLLSNWFTKEFLCILWFVLDSSLEFGQLFITSSLAYKIIPDSFSSDPVIDKCIAFFQNGTYDPLDILSIFLGCFIAYLIGTINSKKSWLW